MFTAIAFLLAFVSPASAERLGRSLDGEMVDTALLPAATVVVFWSMDCSGCGVALRELQSSGNAVVYVNTDAAAQGSQLRAYVHQQGLSAPVIQDQDGRLQRRYGISAGAVLLEQGQVVAVGQGAPERAVALLELPQENRALAVVGDAE